MLFHMVYKSGQIFLPFCHNPRVWRTDGQTDGRIDRILIAGQRLHSMQRGKNDVLIFLMFYPLKLLTFVSSTDLKYCEKNACWFSSATKTVVLTATKSSKLQRRNFSFSLWNVNAFTWLSSRVAAALIKARHPQRTIKLLYSVRHFAEVP